MKQSVLITGGSRGIGAAAVLAFARAGYDVAFTWNHHGSAAEQILAKARQIAPDRQFLALCADAADPAQVAMAVRRAEQNWAACRSWSATPVLPQQKLFTDTSDEDWRRIMSVDLDGAFYACRAALPGMIHRKYGRILLVSSMWGRPAAAVEVAYSAAKAGLIGLGKALAKEEGPSGITGNVVAPGVIDTDMMAGFSEEDRAALARGDTRGRLGMPEEIARTLVFLPTRPPGTLPGRSSGRTVDW